MIEVSSLSASELVQAFQEASLKVAGGDMTAMSDQVVTHAEILRRLLKGSNIKGRLLPDERW